MLTWNYPTGICHTFQKSEKHHHRGSSQYFKSRRLLFASSNSSFHCCSSNALRVDRENQMNANISILVVPSAFENQFSNSYMVTWHFVPQQDNNNHPRRLAEESQMHLSPHSFLQYPAFHSQDFLKLLFNTHATPKHSKRR
jgi:hypothetical protein